ncbi:MAG: hypothetical protein AB2693_29205 [Candidatus Thiodiazotropha sp.]
MDDIFTSVRRFTLSQSLSIFSLKSTSMTPISKNCNMPHKRLKSVVSQRKITDFAFCKPVSANPNTTLERQDVIDEPVHEIINKDDYSAPEKRDFQHRWLQQHHWLQ